MKAIQFKCDGIIGLYYPAIDMIRYGNFTCQRSAAGAELEACIARAVARSK